jgi:hypothetical protein
MVKNAALLVRTFALRAGVLGVKVRGFLDILTVLTVYDEDDANEKHFYPKSLINPLSLTNSFH